MALWAADQARRNMNIITVENNGAELVKTNYWKSEYNSGGFYYVSVNAGCFRLLVPESREADIAEMKTGKFAEISRRSLERIDSEKPMFRIMFDDETVTPYCLDLSQEQFDRIPAQSDHGNEFHLAVYGKSGKILELKCFLK